MKLKILKSSSTVELPDEVFGQTPNQTLIWEAVRAYQANKRQGTAATKTRGEVSGGGRKPWRQKHTGRARAGSIRSPVWRGGGTVFGPKPHSYRIELSKRKRRAALISALSEMASQDRIQVVKELKLSKPKTKELSELIKGFGLAEKKILMLVSKLDEALKLSARNLPRVSVMPAQALNAYDALCHDYLIFTQDGLEALLKKVAG
jgi:large subunit ribosomal protein L4